MHVARNAVMCVPSALVGIFPEWIHFFGLPEGQNMVSLSHGTTVKYYLKYKAQSEAKYLGSGLAVTNRREVFATLTHNLLGRSN